MRESVPSAERAVGEAERELPGRRAARIDRDDWLTFEQEQESLASVARSLRASGSTYAVEVIDGYTPKEIAP